jgi:hypothetical protein
MGNEMKKKGSEYCKPKDGGLQKEKKKKRKKPTKQATRAMNSAVMCSTFQKSANNFFFNHTPATASRKRAFSIAPVLCGYQ